MHRKGSIRWAVMAAAAAIATLLWPNWPGQGIAGAGSGSKDRVLTLTVWVRGTGEAQWDAKTQDPRDGPGVTTRRSKVKDSATAYCVGVARYRVKSINEDSDGGSTELEKIDSICTTLGVSGGGSKADSYHYLSTSGDTNWQRDQASWTYRYTPPKEPWRGPDLDFESSRNFRISPPVMPLLRPACKSEGKGVREAKKKPPYEYRDDFPTYGRKAAEEAFTSALYDHSNIREKLRGRVDWSKPVMVTGHATFSKTAEWPVSLVHIGEQDIVGGTAHSRGSIEINWTLSGEPQGVEMDLIPQAGYDRWLPRGAKDEKTRGSAFLVQFDIHKTGKPGEAPDSKVRKITVRLADTSKESGVCTNYPKPEKTTGKEPDFRIHETADWKVTEEGQAAEAKAPEAKGTIVLDCYDYGAWTNLMATAELADGRHLVGRVKGGSQSAQLAVPKDDNRNRIADTWEPSGIASEASADTDSLPLGNDVEGDGLTLYEEYRGFLCKGRHTRTNPIHKDLFIYDPGSLGIGRFGESGITTHFVDKDEFDTEAGERNQKVINCDRGFGTRGPQHLLHIASRTLPGKLGIAMGDGPGPPRLTALVAIDVAKSNAPWEVGAAAVTAHELGHGVNLWHHGECDYDAYDLEYRRSDGTWIRNMPGETGLRIAAPRGQESGVEECIMRYNAGFAYESAGGEWRWRKKAGGEWIEGRLYPDTKGSPAIFCTQKEGTGMNDPAYPGGPVASNAAVGKCLHLFQVNDLKPAPVPGEK